MKKFVLLVMLLFSAALPAFADDRQIVEKVEDYLNNLDSFQADFTQVDSLGNQGGGKFYLKKPGKFRWEYTKGQPIIILSDGKQLVYYDKQLKEATHASTKNTLAGFLARERIGFSGDVKLLEAGEDETSYRVTVAQKNKPEEGSLTLVLQKEPLQISGLVVTDQAQQKTIVNFINPVFGARIDDKQFTFKDPKFFKEVWENK